MRKKVLVKEAGFMAFMKSFFKAKANDKDSEWLKDVRKINPKIADIFSDYDNKMTQNAQTEYDNLKKLGLSTKPVDDFVKKYGVKIKK